MSLAASPSRLRLRGPLREHVVLQLVDRIVSGSYPPGTALPTEAALCGEFQVSRTVVREAAKVLEEKGLISIHQGMPSTILESDRWNALDSVVLESQLRYQGALTVFEELTMVRVALESELAAEAANRADPVALRQMKTLLEEASSAVAKPENYLEFDVEFHRMVAKASGNRIGSAIMKSIEGPLHVSRRLTNQIPGGVERAHAFHEQIFERIADHNSSGARASMREHLEWSWKNLIASGKLQEQMSRANHRRRRRG